MDESSTFTRLLQSFENIQQTQIKLEADIKELKQTVSSKGLLLSSKNLCITKRISLLDMVCRNLMTEIGELNRKKIEHQNVSYSIYLSFAITDKRFVLGNCGLR